jgi:predicted ATPase/DNA-binding SARP family transcriptional activator
MSAPATSSSRAGRGRGELWFRDLGPLEVEENGESRPVGGIRLESALAVLLIHADHVVGPDALSEAMWGEEGVHRSAATLDSHIWRLRKLLEPHRARGAPPGVLVHESSGYRLVVAADRIDSARFAALAAEAAALLTENAADQALERAEQAAALWRGRPYGSVADHQWAGAAVARLEEIRGGLRQTLIGALLGLGSHDRALAELEIALAEEPLRERLWAYRLSAYRDSGRRAEALATYAEARSVLVDELGIEPGPQLRALHSELLASDTAAFTATTTRDRAPDPPTHTVPVTRSRLVGRDGELAELLSALNTRPLVTLAGAAGCGKTRLAVEAAWRAAARYPDGAWFVDLTSATADRVLDTVTSTLELPTAGPADPAEALSRYTASHRMLVVLDNCEHVLDEAAALVDALLGGPAGGSALTLLATSREPLDVEGEHVLRLEPLPRPAAVELFLERLDGGAPVDLMSSVDEIAAAVDGLPLALELAAGRARAYTLPEIAAQVRADASTLSRVGRTRAGRRGGAYHRTVREAIDTSYRDLPPPLAALHRAAGAVPGPFTAGLAAGLVRASLDSDVTDAVAALAHRSLLTPLGPARRGGASRFAQLATVRGHANHEAERAGEDPAGARDSWIERLVRARPAMGSTRNIGWYRALDDDLAALRATLQHTLVEAPSAAGVALAARLGVYWAFSGMGLEGGRWLRTASDLAATDAGPGRRADRAAVHIDLGGLRYVQGRADEGRAQVRAGIAAAADVTGSDAVLVCTALTVAAGAVARAADREVMGELTAATRRTAAGSAALDVAVRLVELVHATITAPGPGLVPQYLSLHRDARAEDNLYAAWLAAANAARLMLAAGHSTEAVTWARAAVQASAEAGLRHNAYALEVYGAALGRAGEHAAALRVFGAVEEQHRGSSVVWPWDPGVAALLTTMTATLGAAAAALVRAEGARATLAELADP